MMVKNKAQEIFENIDSFLEVSDVLVHFKGTSMWPFFKEGITKVRLSKVQSIKKGNVYLFKENDKFILHRLIKIKDQHLIFRGDGNVHKETVKKEQLIAQMVAFTNKGKKEVLTTNKLYRFKLFVYKLIPRKVVIKLFKGKQ